ncbi:MAG: hypothetical protein CSA22_01845 [Deltaproteobacteria bacterium]|nr:MAG: hypothetical protein CSA22_01845 [Deltaproteobacteria bacterium]
MRVHFFVFNRFFFTQSGKHVIQGCLTLLLIIVVVPFGFRAAFCADTPLVRTHIKVALIESAFLGSNENDAAAAFKTFARTMGKQKGYDMEITVSTFKDAAELAALPDARRPHIAVLESWAFLEIEKEGWLTPVAAASVGRGRVCSSFEILVPVSSPAKTIEDLRGKTINILFMPQTQIGFHWLRSLLRKHDVETMDSFFKDITIENDPMKAVLPVFFDKRDAGLIAAERFELMAELNPQLTQMRAIAISKPLICGITCFNQTGWDSPTVKEDFINAMLELHLSPAGQQILHLFKTDQIVAYRPEDMETVRALVSPLSDSHH